MILTPNAQVLAKGGKGDGTVTCMTINTSQTQYYWVCVCSIWTGWKESMQRSVGMDSTRASDVDIWRVLQHGCAPIIVFVEPNCALLHINESRHWAMLLDNSDLVDSY